MKRTKLLLLSFVSCVAIAMMLPAEKKNREPDYWNELAEACLEEGLTESAFQCYEECIAEGSANSAIFYNFGELLLLSRREAAVYYDADTQLIFDRACLLFEMALEADPNNFEMAMDIAINHWLIQPWRPEEAVLAGDHALSLAVTEDECGQAGVHLARTQLRAGLYNQALDTLARVHSPDYFWLKRKLISRIQPQI